jgi:hypothetical protein
MTLNSTSAATTGKPTSPLSAGLDHGLDNSHTLVEIHAYVLGQADGETDLNSQDDLDLQGVDVDP